MLTGLPTRSMLKLPPAARRGARALGVLPTPQRVLSAGGLCPFADVAVLLPAGEHERLVAERVRGHLRACGLTKVPAVATPEAAERYPIVIAVGDPVRDPRVRRYWEEVTAPLDWQALPPAGYALAIRCRCRRGRVVLAATTAEGLRNAFATFRQLTVFARGVIAAKQAVIVDWPSFELRGMIEGFYHQPWSHQQRLRLLRFAGEYKLNVFAYAPKDDPFHRARWRELYNQRQLRELRQLIDTARDRGVRFCYALHPGGERPEQSIHYSSEDDFQALAAKLESIRALGVNTFAVLLDDIVDVEHLAGGTINEGLRHEDDRAAFPTLGAAHVHLLNRLHKVLAAADPATTLIFCPTEYIGTGGSDYLRSLSALDPAIHCFWTGPQICSRQITPAEADRFAASIGRRPLVWDNYPVNDYDRNRLLLGPIRNRPADLPAHLAGIIANPMNEGEASKLALATIADYLWNPAAYDPAASWELAVMHLAGDGYPALRRFARQSLSSFLDPEESPELAAAIAAFWADYERRGAKADGEELVRLFRGFRLLPAQLERQVDNQFLLADIGGYLQKLRDVGTLGLACVEGLLHPSPRRLAKMEELARHTAANGRRVCDTVIQPFVARALAEMVKEGA